MKKRIICFILTLVMLLSMLPTAALADDAPQVGPTLVKDPNSPTGYTGQFVYYAPNATKVYFNGDLMLSNHADQSDTKNYDPTEYQPGFMRRGGVSYKKEMTSLGDGYWYFELPLAAGANQYWFTEDNGRRMMPDPGNHPNWSPNSNESSKDAYNCLYVPYDAEKQNYEPLAQRMAELPHVGPNKGTWSYVPYEADGKTYYMAVYLPFGYDANRAEPYKTIYLIHGYGQDESDWMGIGSAQNIMDNLISEGRTEPAVLVSISNNNGAMGDQNTKFGNLFNVILPFVEKNYNVSKKAEDRSLSGLSMGSRYTKYVMEQDPTAFGYYGLYSCSETIKTDTPNLDKAHIFVGCGCFEAANYQNGTNTNTKNLEAAGSHFATVKVAGYHDFNTWNQLLRVYLESYVWKPAAFGNAEAIADSASVYYQKEEAPVVGAEYALTVRAETAVHGGTLFTFTQNGSAEGSWSIKGTSAYLNATQSKISTGSSVNSQSSWNLTMADDGGVTLQNNTSSKYFLLYNGSAFTVNKTNADPIALYDADGKKLTTLPESPFEAYVCNPDGTKLLSESAATEGAEKILVADYVVTDQLTLEPIDLIGNRMVNIGNAGMWTYRDSKLSLGATALDYVDGKPLKVATADGKFTTEVGSNAVTLWKKTAAPVQEGSYLALTSDIHHKFRENFAVDSETGAIIGDTESVERLSHWLNKVSAENGGIYFDQFVSCGDQGDANLAFRGADYWDRVLAAMNGITNHDKVLGGGFFINGNHEWQNGTYNSFKNSHPAAKRILAPGYVEEADDYIVYSLSAAETNNSYNTADIDALRAFLATAPTDKPIFIASHYPLHNFGKRNVQRKDDVVSLLNEYGDKLQIIFLWGHNHTDKDTHYGTVYTEDIDGTPINFTYVPVGCMTDEEYDEAAVFTSTKGTIAYIAPDRTVTLTFYDVNFNVQSSVTLAKPGTPTEADEDVVVYDKADAPEAGSEYVLTVQDESIVHGGTLFTFTQNGSTEGSWSIRGTSDYTPYLNATQSKLATGKSVNAQSSWNLTMADDGAVTLQNNTSSKYYLLYSGDAFTVSKTNADPIALYDADGKKLTALPESPFAAYICNPDGTRILSDTSLTEDLQKRITQDYIVEAKLGLESTSPIGTRMAKVGDAALFSYADGKLSDGEATLTYADGKLQNVEVKDGKLVSGTGTLLATLWKKTAIPAQDKAYLFVTSDPHYKYRADFSSSVPAGTAESIERLEGLINQASEDLGGVYFDHFVSCGDNGDGNSSISGQPYWDRVGKVMETVASNENVIDSFYILGNHEWHNGNYEEYQTTNSVAKLFRHNAEVEETDDYILYSFSAGDTSNVFESEDIAALDSYLATAPTDKPIFIASHFPAHNIPEQSIKLSEDVVATMNKYGDTHQLIYLWGHNHDEEDFHYGTVYTGTLDDKPINFTYAAAGCLNDIEYSSHSANIPPKAFTAEIAKNGNITITYYGIDSETADGNTYKILSTTTVSKPEGHKFSKVEAKAATCTEAGAATACWYCSNCDRYFSDEKAENEIAKESVVIPALGHDYVNNKCTRCGKELGIPTGGVTYVKADTIEAGKSYVIVSNGMALQNKKVEGIATSSVKVGYSLAGTPVTVEDGYILSEVSDDMIWDFSEGTSQYAGAYEGKGFFIKPNGSEDLFLRRTSGSTRTAGLDVTATGDSEQYYYWATEKDDAGNQALFFYSEKSGDYIFFANYVESIGAFGAPGSTACTGNWQAQIAQYPSELYEVVKTEAPASKDIDFTNPADASKFTVVNQSVSEIKEGEGFYMISTNEAFEHAKEQLSGDAAKNPRDVVEVAVAGDWTATLALKVNCASGGAYEFFGFYGMTDYENGVGIRAGNGSTVNFKAIGGAIESSTTGLKVSHGLTTGENHWYKLEKVGTTYTGYTSEDGQSFEKIFTYENTGVDATKIVIDAYSGRDVGYEYWLQSLTFEGGEEPEPCKHDYQAVVTAPTCVDAGFTTYTCAKCGDSYVDDEVKALGHSYVTTKTPATCTERGYTTYICTRCGDTYDDDFVAALGHEYKNGYCTRCGEADPSYVPTGDESEALKAAQAAVAAAKQAQAAAEAAKAAAEDAAKAAAADSTAAEAAKKAAKDAQDKAEAAQAAAVSAQKAAEAADSDAAKKAAATAQSAAAAAASAAEAAKAQAACASAQAKAEAAQKAAEAAQKAADEAAKKGEAAADEAKDAQKAADDAKAAADEAKAAAKLSAEAAEKSNAAAAESAKKAAAEAAKVAEALEQVAAAKAEVADAVAKAAKNAADAAAAQKAAEEAQKAAELAKAEADAAELGAIKYSALTQITLAATIADAPALTAEALAQLVKQATAAIDAAENAEAVEEALNAFLKAVGNDVEECPSSKFIDAPAKGNWAHDAIDYCVANGLMEGVSDTKFDTEGTLTRAMLVTILWRAAEEPKVEDYELTFEDVEDGKWYTEAIRWAAAEEIVTGYNATTFGVNDPITRQQIAAILYRYAKVDAVEGTLEAYPDADQVGNYAVDAMIWATTEGIITGVKTSEGNILAPKATATRAQIATIIMRYLEK